MRTSLFVTAPLAASLILLATAGRPAGPAIAAAAAPQAGAPQAQAPGPAPIVFKPVVPGKAPESHYRPEQVRRGGFLVSYGGCNECHTPWKFDAKLGAPAPDMTRRLSGHPEGAPGPYGSYTPNDIGVIGPTFTSFALPFGVVYSPNLTPDIDTGTGSWTERMFIDTFRKGKHLGGNGRPILPPMPFAAVAALPDEDLIAIFAYLRSLPPLRNGVETLNPPQPVQDAIDKGNQEILRSLRAGKQPG